MIKIMGVAFITSISALILRASKPELSLAVTVTGIIVILTFVAELFQDTIAVFVSITQISGLENGLLKVLLKIVGVGYLTEFGAGVLKDFGNHAIADKVTLAGKLTILLLSMPVLENLLRLIGGFLNLM
jgi:stage III sporulation protein AD